MAFFPRLQDPAQLQTGDQSLLQYVPKFRADGGMAIAKGISELGDVAAKISAAESEANDSRVLIEADGRMQDLSLELQKIQQETTDESQWEPQAQALFKGFEEQFAEAKLSPQARQRLQQDFKRFTTHTLIGLRRNAFVHTGERAIKAADALARRHAAAGDAAGVARVYQKVAPEALPREQAAARTAWVVEEGRSKLNASYRQQRQDLIVQSDWEGVHALDRDMRGKGVISDEEFGVAEREYQQQTAWLGFTSMADADPFVAKSLLAEGDFAELNETQRNHAAAYAENKLHEYQGLEVEQLANAMAAGAIKDSSQVRFQWNRDETMQARVRTELDKVPYTYAHAAEERVWLESAVQKYVKEADPDRSEMIRISARLQRMPPGSASDLQKLWDKRRQGKAASMKESLLAAAIDVMQASFTSRSAAMRDQHGIVRAPHLKAYREQSLDMVTKIHTLRTALAAENLSDKDAREIVDGMISATVADEVSRKMMQEEDQPPSTLQFTYGD